jgi:hypothetical protein
MSSWVTAQLRLALRFATRSFGLMLVLAAVAGTARASALPPPDPVPEIDPGSLLSCLTLLGSGALLLTEKLRRK